MTGPGGEPFTDGHQILSPRPIPDAPHVRVISPSSPALHLTVNRRRRALRALSETGVRYSLGRSALAVSRDLRSAGSPEIRAMDFMDAAIDPAVDLILSADGGDAAHEILPHLDAGAIRSARTPFLGYSDNISINFYLLNRAGLVSYYGCCLMVQFGEPGGVYREFLAGLKSLLQGTQEMHYQPVGWRTNQWAEWLDPSDEASIRSRLVPPGMDWLIPGRATGRLVGAEISYLPSLFEAYPPPSGEPLLVFWDVAATNEDSLSQQIDALLTAISDWDVRGMLVGVHPGVPPSRWRAVLRRQLLRHPRFKSIPTLVNTDLSHLSPSWVVPFGALASMDPDRGLVAQRCGRRWSC